MTKFYFFLNVDLPPGHRDPMSYLDALYEAGCDDSLVGIGGSSLRVHFVRDGDDMYSVIAEAEASVRRAIPEAQVSWRWDREAEEYDRDTAGGLDSEEINEIVDKGFRDIEEGRFITLNGPEDVRHFMERIQRQVKRRAQWRALKRWVSGLAIRGRKE